MAFYVPLGPRGLVFRLGTMIISVTGAVRYWLAYRRRPALITACLATVPVPDF